MASNPKGSRNWVAQNGGTRWASFHYAVLTVCDPASGTDTETRQAPPIGRMVEGLGKFPTLVLGERPGPRRSEIPPAAAGTGGAIGMNPAPSAVSS